MNFITMIVAAYSEKTTGSSDTVATTNMTEPIPSRILSKRLVTMNAQIGAIRLTNLSACTVIIIMG